MLRKFRKKRVNNSASLQHIECELKLLSAAAISDFKSYGENSLGVYTFGDWARSAKDLRDPDRIRNALYFGFQPLYDCLVENALSDGNRPTALKVLDELTAIGVIFLTGYYKGQPNTKEYGERMNRLVPEVERLTRERYKTKFRNIDHNGIYPDQINRFLRQFLECTLDGKIFVPEYVVGCACGSSEVVMPLAGVLDVDVGFIRRSWRRGDDAPRFVKEQKDRIIDGVKGKDVVCVEDYVCTGGSLNRVVDKVISYHPRNIRGLSVNAVDPSTHFRSVVNMRKLQIWEPK